MGTAFLSWDTKVLLHFSSLFKVKLLIALLWLEHISRVKVTSEIYSFVCADITNAQSNS